MQKNTPNYPHEYPHETSSQNKYAQEYPHKSGRKLELPHMYAQRKRLKHKFPQEYPNCRREAIDKLGSYMSKPGGNNP